MKQSNKKEKKTIFLAFELKDKSNSPELTVKQSFSPHNK